MIALVLLALPLRAEPAVPEAALVARGNALYFQGRYAQALDAYGRQIKKSSATLQAWLNGAEVLEETGRAGEAARWYAKAASLSPDPDVAAALGWSQWRARRLDEAAQSFARALRRDPRDVSALLGSARLALEQGDAKAAVASLQKAEAAAPLLTVLDYYEGQALDKLGDVDGAIAAYKKAVIGDSFFVEGREALGRAYLRRKAYNDAWLQFNRVLDAEPHSKRVQLMVDRLRPLLTRRPSELRPNGLHKPLAYLVDSPPVKGAPVLRIGIGTNGAGKPRPRLSATFKCTQPFDLVDSATGRRLGQGDADDQWSARVRRVKKKWQLLIVDPDGRTVSQKSAAVTVRPRDAAKGVIILDDVPGAGANPVTAGRALRGQLELASAKKNLRLVNVIDLESYTQGVVAAEMPIKSPLEALKAQAVMARTHALYVKKLMDRRHKKDGYDLCDGDHCQVYAGVRAESERSREVVDATRGRVMTYKGRLAQGAYLSNCGGFTQSGADVTGWGDVPYWKGISDGADLGPRPRSPWELRQWLASWPAAYCKPSNDVHPSHFRWTRVLKVSDLEDKLNKKLRIGKLKALTPLRRSSAGNVNAIQIVGTRKKVKLDSETQIRSLLGLGSLRSTLFLMEAEYDAKGRPQTLVVHGGGWGHGVGLCQSGAMGRAEAGQTYEEIIKAYFKGVELSSLTY